MIPNKQNELNDLKISANEHLDKYYPEKKKEMIGIRKALLRKNLRQYAEEHQMPLKTELDMVKVVAKAANDESASPEEYILQVGIYALAWDEIKLEEAEKVASNPIVKPWKPQ